MSRLQVKVKVIFLWVQGHSGDKVIWIQSLEASFSCLDVYFMSPDVGTYRIFNSCVIFIFLILFFIIFLCFSQLSVI